MEKNHLKTECWQIIGGRVESTKRLENGYVSVVTCPSLDQFSQPNVYEIHSRNPLGQMGDFVDLRVRNKAFRKPFSYNDRNTGQRTTGFNNIVIFSVDE